MRYTWSVCAASGVSVSQGSCLSPFVLYGWDADIMAGTAAATLEHSIKIPFEQRQSNKAMLF